MPSWCNNYIDVAGPHTDAVAAPARFMACEVDGEESMSDIAHGKVLTQSLPNKNAGPLTVPALAASKIWGRAPGIEGALIAVCFDHLPWDCRLAIRFTTSWEPPWANEVKEELRPCSGTPCSDSGISFSKSCVQD